MKYPKCPKCTHELASTPIDGKLDMDFLKSLAFAGTYLTCDCGYARIDFAPPLPSLELELEP